MKQQLLKSDHKLYEGANEAQIAAITHESGPVMCLAGPGSGKTFVLTRHIRYLIKEKHIEPQHILVITFSKAAANEMQKRFIELMDGEYHPVRFGTFHSVFFHLLSKYEHYKSSDILTFSQKKKYLKTALLQMSYDGKKDTESIENILSAISHVKNHSKEKISVIENEIPHFKEIYDKYESIIRMERKLDFDDMMLLCHELLTSKPEILLEYKKSIEHVLIDEYQDINPIQYELVKKIIAPSNNLFVVGDDDQSIYGFRGCNPQIMLAFKEEFPEGEVITFPYNYRCTPSIVDAAGKLISHNKTRYQKNIQAYKTSNIPVNYIAYPNKEAEYDDLVLKLHEMHENDNLLYSQTACLFRTNMEASYLAERLLKDKLPYQMKEKPYNPYEHFIAKDFLHYLYLANGTMSAEHFVPVMNKPLRYIARDSIDSNRDAVSLKKIMEFYSEKEYMQPILMKLEYDLKRMQKMDVFAAINYIRKGIGYDEYIKKYAAESCTMPQEYIFLANDFHNRMGEHATLDELQFHIDNYRDKISNFSKEQTNDKKKGIHIMTYHASKGLEFDTVYLPDCNEGIIPYKKSLSPEEIEEERRLFYVAMTRAKNKLNILYVDGDRNNRHLVSRFVKESKKAVE